MSNHLAGLRRIAAAAEAADGAAPLDEGTWLALRHDRTAVRLRLEESALGLVHGGQLTLVVHPDARGRGLGSRLLAELLEEVGDAPLSAWSHADHPAARRLAEQHGFERVRELWVMHRPTSLPLDEVVAPEGVVIRGFRDSDTDALLALNAASFAAHPEQGGMDHANFAARLAEPWWDPAGLLVAERDGRLVAFHWTKVHSPALGEVYVVGVDPDTQGLGLGRVMTLAGLHHLAARGVEDVHLYVEADNAPAIRVYRDKLGFTHAPQDTHVMYRRG